MKDGGGRNGNDVLQTTEVLAGENVERRAFEKG
jgi:hypothetical protein